MPRPNLEGLGDVLSRMIAAHRHKPAFQLALCTNAWRALLGELAVQKTRKLTFSDGTLTAYLQSDSLRHELSAQRQRLLEGLQEELKDQLVINELILK
jgi:predicted nucleic acid-binding Zn ribbon protein